MTKTKKNATPNIETLKQKIRPHVGQKPTDLEIGLRENRADGSNDDTPNMLLWNSTPGSSEICDDDNDLVDVHPIAGFLRSCRRGDIEGPFELDVYVRGTYEGEATLLDNVTVGRDADGNWFVEGEQIEF